MVRLLLLTRPTRHMRHRKFKSPTRVGDMPGSRAGGSGANPTDPRMESKHEEFVRSFRS
jgi:hypothetical protein